MGDQNTKIGIVVALNAHIKQAKLSWSLDKPGKLTSVQRCCSANLSESKLTETAEPDPRDPQNKNPHQFSLSF